MRSIVIPAVLLAVLLAPTVVPAGDVGSVPGEVLVRLAASLDDARLAELLARVGARRLPFRAPGHLLRLAARSGDAVGLLRRLNATAAVAGASTNALCRAASVDDPYFLGQWNLHQIGVEAAWRVQADAVGVTVAVVDTGVAYRDASEDGRTHRVAPGLTGTPIIAPWDFVHGDGAALDEHGHGTHVATVIAQAVDDAAGGAGVAPGVALMPLRVLDADARGTEADVVQAILYAAEQGAEVINLSLTFDPGYAPSPALREAVAVARARGVVLVGAAGNDHGGPVLYPAALRDVIAVGAARLAPGAVVVRAEYSAADGRLDLLAPGGDLSRDEDRDGVPDGVLGESFPVGRPEQVGPWLQAGTSVAAAQVSGTAALLLAAGVAPGSVPLRLGAAARDLGPAGFDAEHGHGLLDAGAALAAAHAPVGEPPVRYVSVAVKLRSRGWRGSELRADLELTDADGREVTGERVFGRWFGKLAERVECVTDGAGRCRLVRPLDPGGPAPGPVGVDGLAGLVVDRSAGAAGLGTSPQGLVRYLVVLWYRWLVSVAGLLGLDLELWPEEDEVEAQGLGTSPVGFRYDLRLLRYRTENPFARGVRSAGARDASVGARALEP